jgi:hypothetical protein
VKHIACRQPGCPLRLNGQCLEAFEHPADECPHVYFNDGEDGGGFDETEDFSSDSVKLFLGEELSLERTTFVRYQYDTRLIFVVGEKDCGKTTLLAELFEGFQFDQFKNYKFAGSFTQIGFEKRCYLSRVNSKSKKADTERTKSLEFNFLHLAVQPNVGGSVKHLLISDISGERFQQARDNSHAMAKMQLLSRADHILFVIDGSKLADAATKWTTLDRAKMFVKHALDQGVFNNYSRIRVVISKWDKIVTSEAAIIEELVECSFSKLFENKIEKLSFSKIASRGEEYPLRFKLGFGLDNLLDIWTREMPITQELGKVEVGKRFFDKYFVNDPSNAKQ